MRIEGTNNSPNCFQLIIHNLPLITAVALAVIGILAAANVSGLQAVNAYWYTFEIAALACLIVRIVICCKSKSRENVSESSSSIEEPNERQQPNPVHAASNKAATYSEFPENSDRERIFIEGQKLRNDLDLQAAREKFLESWQQGYALAGFALASSYFRENFTDQRGYEVLAKLADDMNYLEALFSLAHAAAARDMHDHCFGLLQRAAQLTPDEALAQEILAKIEEAQAPAEGTTFMEKLRAQNKKTLALMDHIHELIKQEKKKREEAVNRLVNV